MFTVITRRRRICSQNLQQIFTRFQAVDGIAVNKLTDHLGGVYLCAICARSVLKKSKAQCLVVFRMAIGAISVSRL